MAKAIYNEDGSVTYRGETFRVGDKVKICRDTFLTAELIKGPVEIDEIGQEGVLYVKDTCGGSWPVLLENLFECFENETSKPWEMPKLKSGMRVVGQFSTHLVVEVNGSLFGVCEHGWAVVDALYEIAVEVYSPPTEYTDNPWTAMCTTQKGGLLWSRKEADKQRQAYEAKEARRQEIQLEIDKLKDELRGLDDE